MNEKLKINDKMISLYKFIEEFCKVKNRIITNDENYIWNYKIDNIPEDDENISLEYSDKTDDDDSNEDLNYLLKVHKPEFQKCPEPPHELKKWLFNDWNYHKNDAKIRQQIELNDSNEKDPQFENFDDDSKRRILFEEWLHKRDNWVVKQREIEKTRDFFTELYMKYIDLQRESETIEVIIANGYIKDKNNSNIFHPILTKRLNMSFNASENTIYILNTNAKSELYTELFQVMEDINLECLSTLNTDLMQYDYHPMDRNDTKEFLKVLSHKISSDSKFVDEGEEEDNNNRILMFYKPSIIIRKRLDGTIKAIEQIIKNIEDNGFIPAHLLDIVNGGVIERSEEVEETVEELLAKTGGESVDILLTKEANKEQLEIAKRIDMYNAVLVQGPPGTGKTHTIANLVGDFLAKGKSILVTSYTKKALNVLKEKLPKNMQSLCVSVLDDSNEDMENSIDGITEYMSKYTSFELSKQKEELKQERIKIIDELSKNRKKIYDILNTEYKSIILNGEEISPSDAATFIMQNKEKLNYINGEIKLYSPLPISEKELNYLYSTNNKISGEEEKELNYKLPNPEFLIKPTVFSDSLNKINKSKTVINDFAMKKNWKIDIQKDVYIETDFGKFYVPNLNFDNINELKSYIDKFKLLEPWCINICCDGKKDGAYKKQWTTLISKIKLTSEINEYILDKYFGKSLTYEIEDLNNNKNSIVKLKEIFEKNKKLNKLNLLFNSDLNKTLNLNVINNSTIKTFEDCDYILKNIELYNARNELEVIWNKLMATNGLKDFFELDEKEPEKIAEKYIENIEYYLNWYSKDYKELLNVLSKNNIPDQIVLRVNNLDKDLEQVNKIINALDNDLPYIVDICINKIEISKLNDEIEKSIDLLDDNLLINSAICINMKTSLINCDEINYLQQFKELEETYNKYEVLFKRNELMGKIEEVAPTWASDMRNRIGIHGQNSCPPNIKDAWKYKQLDLILESLTSESLDSLQKKSQKLSKDYRNITEEYAEKCAWYGLLSKTECDIDMKQALKGWELTIKKIGKGTGKNAAKHKAQARELMAKCQNAVPCWIMPINKAIESLKPGKNEFDVIIIDEASQSDISSLAIAYLGKKMIVVGDDKQVSPMAIGTEIDKINALEQMYIKDKIPNSHLYGSKTSLYDIAATTFQPLMLKEHFRCVPEIIGFSNMLSYDYKIKPLRDSGSSNLIPAMINYRVNGKRVGKINKIEAETIVAQIKSCITMEEYKNKSFGIISLLGEDQVKLIQTLMFKYIDPKDIEKRKILVGNASNFQGDERDIIFLSMVDSSNENGGPLSYSGPGVEDSTKKRYNVAVSRAKDQLWVVNSLDAANDLKPGDIRKKLLDYATNPDVFAFKEEEIKKKADSVFEVQVANKLVSEGYHITQQYPVGAYRLDIVAIYKNSKVVIECDGERYHSGDEKVREDMQRQAILERIGWRFIRIRGSQYFKNPELEMTRVIKQLNVMGIYPENEKNLINNRTSELLEKVKLESFKYLAVIQDGKEPEIEYRDILYALDSNKNINKLKESESLNNYISNKKSEKENYNSTLDFSEKF
ncbi:MAG: AAA domain-containing protein [Bacilli bacterium]